MTKTFDQYQHGRNRFTVPPAATMLTAVFAASVLVITGCSSAPSSQDDEQPVAFGSSDDGRPTLRAVDGGADFYGQFTNGLPTDPTYFPLGVWSESVVDEMGWPRDKAAGLNTYVAPLSGSDLSTIKRAGMYALPAWMETTAPVAGYSASDEVDMWAGPGDAPWTGNVPGQGEICSSATEQCGYTVMESILKGLPPGMMSYSNFGKGVVFWQTDEEAARFVNDFVDVVSVDTYWFTDAHICGATEGGALLKSGDNLPEEECRLASNYGATTERVRSLVNPTGSKPVWNFVEVGHPAKEADAPTITGPQIRAAVWSSIIHGARGIVYFNHSFGGDCQTQHVLRDCPGPLPATTAVNAQITRLAPVLNAPFVDNLVQADTTVDVSTKLANGQFYLIAGSKTNTETKASMKFTCGNPRTAIVVDENREVPIRDGVLTDEFQDGNTVHIYKIQGGDTCGLAG